MSWVYKRHFFNYINKIAKYKGVAEAINKVEAQRSVPVIGLAGFSNSGKTTFLEKLIAVLTEGGYRVGVIKHTHHHIDFDQSGKDSWRHAQAGAEIVALASKEGVSLFKRFATEPEPEAVLDMMGDVDLILVEGYKLGKWPKIEIYRQGTAERVNIPREELLALVTDEPSVSLVQEVSYTGSPLPCFDLNDAAGVAALLERTILK